MEEHLTVGRVAELSGVTVRTLHHYDEIGLVQPSARTAAGYRAYSAPDVERLRAVRSLRADLEPGKWAERNHELIELDAAELGRRLLVA